jgi:two-component system, OmpR family, sensor kinase
VGLTATLQKMGHGDLSVRVPVKGSGELREMAISYNTMAEQLESLDKSRNQFVSNASHELKTPLTTMKILLESLIYQPDMPQELRTEFMQDMDHEIDRLSGIVTDLLTLTRMDDHKMELHLADTDISQLTEENLRLLMPMAEKRKQTLHADIVPGIMAEVDSAKMSQVFYNLIENALKYTPDGGEVTVSLVRDGENLLWRGRGNGVGIPEEDLPHIFERFYRVDKARSRDTGGTGLGLSIVKQITALHGGEITVKSTLGQGSIFTLTLPMKEDAHS